MDSFANDSRERLGVVLGRAATTLRSIETLPKSVAILWLGTLILGDKVHGGKGSKQESRLGKSLDWAGKGFDWARVSKSVAILWLGAFILGDKVQREGPEKVVPGF